MSDHGVSPWIRKGTPRWSTRWRPVGPIRRGKATSWAGSGPGAVASASEAPSVVLRRVRIGSTSDVSSLCPRWTAGKSGMLRPAMGQTRVDLQHLLEDLRDAYPDAIEETILSEVVANSLDSGATSVHVLTDPTGEDGRGGGRRLRHGPARAGPVPRPRRQHEDARRGHRLRRRGDQARAAGRGGRPDGDAARQRARGHSLAPRLATEGAVAVGGAAGLGGRARHRRGPEAPQPVVAAPRRRATSRAACSCTTSRSSTRPSTRSWPTATRRAFASR